MPPESFRRSPADRKAWRLWVRDWITLQVVRTSFEFHLRECMGSKSPLPSTGVFHRKLQDYFKSWTVAECQSWQNTPAKLLKLTLVIGNPTCEICLWTWANFNPSTRVTLSPCKQALSEGSERRRRETRETRAARREEKKEIARVTRANEICVSLTTQNRISWWVKRWQQTFSNRSHWQVDDGWSTAEMFVTFPENRNIMGIPKHRVWIRVRVRVRVGLRVKVP